MQVVIDTIISLVASLWWDIGVAGVIIIISSFPLISGFFTIVKILYTCWISRWYLTYVAADQLRWHPSNMHVISGMFDKSNISLTDQSTNGALATPTLDKFIHIFHRGQLQSLDVMTVI